MKSKLRILFVKISDVVFDSNYYILMLSKCKYVANK